MVPFLFAMFIGQPKIIEDASGTWTSSIGRSFVHDPVELHITGLAGDLRVLESGAVSVSEEWKLLERDNEDGSIPAINRCMYLDFDIDFTKRITQMRGLADW
jgi:hypothetical protein